MLIVFGILLMFTEATSGLLFQDPVVCNFNKNNQCYVAEGQQLHLPMPKEERFYVMFTDKTSNPSIIKYYNKRKPTSARLTTWQFVTDNTTLILSSAKRNDSGTYTLERSSSDGKTNGTFTLQLNVEAQVSSVNISYNCLASEVMKVDCSADGDELRFNWTSDFNGGRSVELAKNHQGNITCYVENHVSRDHRSIPLHPCPKPTTRTSTAMTSASPSKQKPGTNSTVSHKETNSCNRTLTTSRPSSINKSWFQNLGLIIMSSVCVLLVIIAFVAFCIYRRTHGTKNKKAISQEGRERVPHFSNGNTIDIDTIDTRTSRAKFEDVEYAVVVPRASKKKQKTDKDEVQYGELVFNTPAKNRRQTPKVQDDCIYSQVHHRS